ncbi:nucleotidyltransferase domain-containing protein [Oceanospirillum sp.]|uniref:nucleotidyltransferase domain-containing protein n=1 Tax=Oceanospirillum sp. TaxID=2021254 RepID=UPI003A9255F4
MTTDLKALPDIIERLFAGRIRLAYLFGSFASGRAGEHGDLDLAILPSQPVSDEDNSRT